MAMNCRYFKSLWNWLDLIMIFTGILDLVTNELSSGNDDYQLQGSSISTKTTSGLRGKAVKENLEKINRFLRVLRVLKVLRSFRALRVLRTIRFIKAIHTIVKTCSKAVPAMASIAFIMIILTYIAALIARNIFSGPCPEKFGNLVKTFFSLFTLLTLDDWYSIYQTCQERDLASLQLIFCLTYIFFINFVLLNLLMAVLVDSFQQTLEDTDQKNESMHPTLTNLSKIAAEHRNGEHEDRLKDSCCSNIDKKTINDMYKTEDYKFEDILSEGGNETQDVSMPNDRNVDERENNSGNLTTNIDYRRQLSLWKIQNIMQRYYMLLESLEFRMERHERLAKTEKAIRTILDHAQNSALRHLELLKSFSNLYIKSSQDVFHDEFLRCIAIALVNPPTSKCTINVLNFISSFLTLEIQGMDETSSSVTGDLFNPILPRVIEFFAEQKNNLLENVRGNICVLIYQTLEKMVEDAELDEKLFELLVNVCLELMNDKNVRVRLQAAKSAGRLQNTRDIDDLITKRLIWLMDHDSSAAVRKEALVTIAITRTNLPPIMRRLTDVDKNVRLAAFSVFSTKIQSMKVLNLKDRCKILELGIDDVEADVVHGFVHVVVKTWIGTLENKTILGLLKMIDVTALSEQTGKMLKMLFKENLDKYHESFCQELLNEKKLIPIDKLDCETAFYWQHLAMFLTEEVKQNQDNDDITDKLDSILPELIDLVDIIYEFIASYHNDSSTYAVANEINFTINCLLNIMMLCKFEDLVGRHAIEGLCRDLFFMEEIAPSTYKNVMKVFKLVEPKFQHRLRKTNEMIADIQQRYHRQTDDVLRDRKSVQEYTTLQAHASALHESIQRANDEITTDICEIVRLRNDLNDVRNRIESFDRQQNESGASQNTTSNINLSNDRSTNDYKNQALMKCLTILSEFLGTTMPNKTLPTAFIESSRDLVLSSIMTSHDITVRRCAVRALGLLYAYEKTLITGSIQLLLQVIVNDASQVAIEALHSLGNTFIIHNGVEMKKNTTDEKFAKLIEEGFCTIGDMINSRLLQVRLTAIVFMIKLFFIGQINESQYFAQLIVAWYDQTTDAKTGGMLTTFFPAYADKFWQSDSYLFNALQPSIDGLLNNESTKNEPSYIKDVIKLFLQLHQIRECSVIKNLRGMPPTTQPQSIHVNENNENIDGSAKTDLDITIQHHLNNTASAPPDMLLIEKQKHDARLKYHFHVAKVILECLKTATNDDLIKSLVLAFAHIDISTSDCVVLINLRKKSRKVNQDLIINKRKSNLNAFIKKLNNRIEFLQGAKQDNDSTLNASLNETVANSAVPALSSPIIDTVFRGIAKKKRSSFPDSMKDSILTNTTRQTDNEDDQIEENDENENFATPLASPQSASSSSEEDDQVTADGSTTNIRSNKRAHATSTDSVRSLDLPNDRQMTLRSSARKQNTFLPPPLSSVPSFKQQRKRHRCTDDSTVCTPASVRSTRQNSFARQGSFTAPKTNSN
ncbi:unnamed protein product [Didymodactylos carnosus]|uniref:Condensin complex subunit 1 n=1 Tax=Didymodactylos carnosus TaxID=1234261 RepID=A0A814I9I6_9BILA|nr:unnamed protein product [Didymodactylos carnosus]CAF1022474.1 unnamed protein product [Didymodactylos carnosus]CAF3648935.1 unnamed protein product [Didymodactylos carnosus]CAF3793855.1 unnamed protein product [Didymodactylos carnosus]